MAETAHFPIEDQPHTPDENVPLWTESFCHWSFTPASQVGLHAHFQRNPRQRSLWQELFGLRLGDGTVLLDKSFGLGPAKTVHDTGLRIEIMEPFARWRVGFVGTARRVELQSLREAPLHAGEDIDVEFAMDVVACAPPWRAGNGVSWFHAHYEQAARTTGICNFGTESVAIDGIGYRDHSFGARDFDKFGDSCWLFGVFDDGRSFCAMESRRPAGKPAMRMAYVVEDGEVHDAELLTALPMETPVDGQRFEFELCTSSGVHHVDVEYVDALPITMGHPSQQFHGCWGGRRRELVYYELSIRYALDGQVGYGSGNTTRRYEGRTA